MSQQEVMLPNEVTRKLKRLANHVRKLSVIRGLGFTAIALVICMSVGVLIDLFWELPVAIRLSLLGIAATTVLVTFWRSVIVPALRRFSPNELASIVEQTHPELMERLSSTIELNDPNVPDDHKGSFLMRELLTKQTAKRVGRLNFTQSISPARAQKIAFIAAAAVILWVTPFLFFPGGYSLMVSRFFVPWGNFHSPGNLMFDVNGGDRVVARGKDVPIEVTVRWRKGQGERPETVWLNWTDTTGETDSRRMEFDSQAESYLTNIPHVFHGFDFNVSAHRSRSRNFHVTVVAAPTLTAATLDVEPPAYTGLNAQTIDGVVGDIEVFERSQLKFQLKFNKPMADAKLVWLDPHLNNSQPTDEIATDDSAETPTASQPDNSKFTLASDSMSATLKISTESSGPFSIQLTDEHGLNNENEPQRLLIVTADQPPTLEVAGSDRPQEARPSDIVPITVTAADDIGLGALELHYDLFRGEETVIPVKTEKLGLALSHQFELDLAALGMPEGAVIKFRVRAADERPVPEPNEVWSEPRLITISQKAAPPGTAEVAERQRELKQQLQEIRTGVTENREQVAALQTEAESDLRMQLQFEKTDQIRPLSQQQMELSKQLENLADEFAKHPLYANLVPDAQVIARDDLPETSRKMAEAVDAELQQKAQTFKQANNNLSQVEEKLQKMENQFNELAKLELDLLELNRLAQKAAQLADAAADLDIRRNETPPPNETPQQQQTREQQMTEDQQVLAEEQQRLAQELNDLLDRRPELLEAARQGQLDQLAELAKAAAELVKPQDQLADALEQEAQQSAEKSVPFAEQQEKLVEQAEQLAADINALGDQAPVTPLDPEQLRETLEDIKKGNLQDAIEGQEAAAEDLEALAAELQKNKKLPADPQRAVEELAKRQAELQKKTEQAAENAPQNNATPDQQKQFDRELRKLAAEQAGIEAGLAQVDLPAKNREQQQEAVNKAAETVEQLLGKETEPAKQSADETAQAMEQLARQIGTPEERKQQAAEQLAELRKQQESLGEEVAETLQKNTTDTEPQITEEQLEKLSKKQTELAKKLSELDTPDAKTEHQDAIQKAAAAMTDLQNKRKADAEGSQQKLQQAIANLEKKLAGEELPEDSVARLKKQQDQLHQETKSAVDDSDKNALTKKSQEQKELAEQLAKLDTPSAQPQRQAAQQTAEQAAEQIADGENAEQIESSLERASEALERLAEALDPQQPDPAERAEQLANRQQQAAQASQQAAQSDQSPSAEQLKSADNELKQLTEETKQLRVGDAAQAEKTEALEQLQKAADAQKLASQTQPGTNPTKDQQQQLRKQEATAQQAAADALERLQKKLASDDSQQQLAQNEQQSNDQADKLMKQQQSDPQKVADAAEQLANEQAELREETESLDDEASPQELAKASQPIADNQKQLQEKASQLPADTAPLSRAQAMQHIEKAEQALQKGDVKQAASQQQQAEQALRDVQRQAEALAQAESSPMSNDQTAAAAQQAAQQAQQLAKQQRELQQQIAQSMPQQQPSSNNQPNSNQPDNAQASNSPSSPGNSENPSNSAQPQQGNQPQQNNQQQANQAPTTPQQALQQQQRLAAQAAQAALDVAREAGPESEAAQQATEFARQANDSAQQAMVGQLGEAGETAQDAAQTAQVAAEQLRSEQQGQPQPNSQLNRQLNDLAQQQQQLSEAFEQMAGSPANSRNAQQQGQQQLAVAANDLAQRLDEAARRLAAEPLNLNREGQQAQSAQQSTQQGQQSMQQAAQNIQQGNPGDAAQAARDAAQALQQAASQAGGIMQQQPNQETPVPPEVGSQVAEAAQQLEQAGQQLAQQNNQQGQQAGQNSDQQNPSSQNGQQGQQGQQSSQSGQSQQANNQNGQPNSQGQNGQQQSSSPSQSTQSLRQAAQSLAQAAQQLQPSQGNQNSQQNGSNQQNADSQQGQPGESADGIGTQVTIDMKQLENELQKLTGRNWGQLPGKLRTEILQASRQKPDGDYARLIKLYFQEIAKSRPKSSANTN